MTDTEIKELFEANGQFATGKDYALIRAFEIIIRQQRTWVKPHEWRGLTDEEIATTADYFKDAYGFTQGVLWAEAKLKEKNT